MPGELEWNLTWFHSGLAMGFGGIGDWYVYNGRVEVVVGGLRGADTGPLEHAICCSLDNLLHVGSLP